MSIFRRVISRRIGSKLWIHFEGRTYVADAVKQTTQETTSATDDHSAQLNSPMPGKVLLLKCKNKQQVRKGELLCVLEAMKMEYQLSAPFDGTVDIIHVEEGQQVTLGQKLLEVSR